MITYVFFVCSLKLTILLLLQCAGKVTKGGKSTGAVIQVLDREDGAQVSMEKAPSKFNNVQLVNLTCVGVICSCSVWRIYM